MSPYTEKETYANTNPENQKLIDVEAEAVHMILNRIGNDIYSIVDVCPNAQEMWIAIDIFDILKQHQNEVNEIRTERIAGNANPLAVVATAQNYPGKEIIKPPTPPSELASEEESDEEHAQRDKHI
ncbi:hypothetical protein Tco_1445007 [Tanacetum coccineum]